MVPVCFSAPPWSSPQDVTGSCRLHHWSGWSPWKDLPRMATAWITFLWPRLVIQQNLVSTLESYEVGEMIMVGLHSVTDHLQMSSGIMQGVMQLFHKVCHMVHHGLLFVGGSPKLRSQLWGIMVLGIFEVWTTPLHSMAWWNNTWPTGGSTCKTFRTSTAGIHAGSWCARWCNLTMLSSCDSTFWKILTTANFTENKH
jgi:hypothetical protein